MHVLRVGNGDAGYGAGLDPLLNESAIVCVREPMRIDELAALSAMSPRTLHRHFRAVTRMTPLDYQKRLRLNDARARLTADPHDVAGVAYAVGYDSPSQFSREYRRMFGAPPTRDATGTREPSVARGGRRSG
jgi:transcriptional regulator GlxA family with amidase domain